MKYIIDTDPGIDDAIAIMMAYLNKLDIIAFTIASGNIPLEKVENNIKVIEDFLGSNIPIYKGSKINECSKETAEYAHGKDGLGYAVFPKNKTRVIEKTYAENAIIKASKKYGDKLSIICLGPTTNLAKAIEKDPNLPKRVDTLYVMGCSYNPRSKKDYLEFNIKIDPTSARKVLSAPFKKIKIVTHEIGVKSFIEKDYVLSLKESDDILSRFVGNIAEKYIEFSYNHYKTIGLGTPDPTTIASVIDESIITYKNANIDITDDGKTIVTLNPNSNTLISTSFDLEKFRKLFKDTFK